MNGSKRIHAMTKPDSLLNLSFYDLVLKDKSFLPQKRAIDANWYYHNIIPSNPVGFSPFTSKGYIAKNSYIAKWLSDPSIGMRTLNEDDYLMNEVSFYIHDYLHNWAWKYILKFLEEKKVDLFPINKNSIEKLVFCHLITEACAVVGLDYWYLCTLDINSICKMGTRFKTLAACYHENDLNEFTYFNSSFNVQEKSFFKSIANSYCEGHYVGFNPEVLSQSPIILKWLRHEIGYGALQRIYTRDWLKFYFGIGQARKPSDSSPVQNKLQWQQELIEEIGQALWDLVKRQRLRTFESSLASVFKSQKIKIPDFRFYNINSMESDKDLVKYSEGISLVENQALFRQFIASFDFNRFDKELIPKMNELRLKGDFKKLCSLLKNQRRITRSVSEEPLLFFLT